MGLPLLPPLLLLLPAALAASFPGSALQQLIDNCIANRCPAVRAPSGDYLFDRSSLILRGARNLSLGVLEAGGALNLIFYPGYGVLIAESADTQIHGPLTVAYDPPCFSQGRIVAVNVSARTLDYAVDAGFPTPDADFFASGELKLQYFDPTPPHLRLRPQGGATLVTVEARVAAGTYRVRMRSDFGLPATPAPGTAVSVSPRIGASRFEVPDYYRGQAWTLYNSSRVLTRDVTLLGSGNFAVTEWGGDGGHVYQRLRVDRAPGSLLSSNCDGFHSFSTGTGGALVDSAIAWMGDDAVNYHNRVGIVLSANASAAPARPASPRLDKRSSSSLSSSSPSSSSFSASSSSSSSASPPLPASLSSSAPSPSTLPSFIFVDVGDIPAMLPGQQGPATAFADLVPGDTLRLFAGGQAGALLGVARVASVARVTDESVLAQARALAARLPASVNLATVGAWLITYTDAEQDSRGGTTPRLALPLQQGDVVQFDRRASNGGLLLNTTFSDAYDTCARFQASNAAILSCSFSRLAGGITVVYDEPWLEGTRGISNVTIAENVFEAVGYPSITDIKRLVTADADVAGLNVTGNVLKP